MTPSKLAEKAPEVFEAAFDTSKGVFVVEVHRAWAPNGADRFYNLVKNGFYDGVRFFRVIGGFMAQFGINGDPKVNAIWRDANIPDDPVKESNKKGYISFAMGGPGTRTTQVFINFVDNQRLDSMGFPPFARVTKGWDVVEKLHAGYGEGAPSGMGPNQMLLQAQGNPYLEAQFPNLDHVRTAKIVK
jgi:peptidyl-prolyl cis-trans isomerase A (cyclophilin A)